MSQRSIIFPGQGSQSVGMGREVAQAGSHARSVFERAARILGYDIGRICFEGPAEELERTQIQQPAIFVTSVALWEAFLETGASLKQFGRTGGLSLGEYTALYVAEAFSFDDALRLVQRRGQFMQEAAQAVPSGMVSLIGADEASARALCDRASEGEVLVPANFNCPGQIVISGQKAACGRAVELAAQFGCRAVALAVAGAFHSPIMEPAAAGLRRELEKTVFSRPAIPVIANVDAEYHETPSAIRESLARQLTQPVYWQRCIERMASDGVEEFVEVGPGRVLTGLMRKINRNAKAVNISSAESLAAAAAA